MTLTELQKEARERMEKHPSIVFANKAVVAQAVRTGTAGYPGEEYYPELLDILIAEAYSAGKDAAYDDMGEYISKHCVFKDNRYWIVYEGDIKAIHSKVAARNAL